METERQQAHPQIQYWSNVTNWPQGNLGRNLWEVTRRTKMIRYQICHSGQRILQIIWFPQKFVHQQTFLRTRIRNIPQKWQQKRGSTVFLLISRKIQNVTPAWEPNNKSLLQKTHWRSSTVNRKVWWFDNGWSQNPQCRMWIWETSRRYAVVVQDLATQWIQSYPCKTKSSHETEKSLFHKILGSRRKHRKLKTQTTRWNFWRACEILSWNHCTSTPHRSETNGIAEREVRRINEGTSAVLLQSGLDERWWSDSMECCCYLRNVQDLLADGKTPCERPFKGPVIPFGAMVDHHPSSPKDQSRIHQFGKKVPPGIFLGYELIAGWIWKGDILVADLEDLETVDASDIYPRRIKANEVLISQEDDEFIFPIADGTAKIVEKRLRFPSTHSKAGTTCKEWMKISVEKFKANRKSLNNQNQQMTLKPVAIFGRFKVTSSFVNTLNHEYKTFLCHWTTLMLPGLLILIWMYFGKRRLTITGMSSQASICQTLGEDSRNSLY